MIITRIFLLGSVGTPTVICTKSPYSALLSWLTNENPMSEPKLIIFDCDGVLIDSEVIAARVEVEFLKQNGYEIDAREHAIRFSGLNFNQSLKIIEEEVGRSFPDDIRNRVEAEIDNRLWRDVVALPGANEILDALDQPRCICSNSVDTRLKMSLTKVGLWDRFRPYIFSALSLPDVAVKPAPDIFLKVASSLDIQPKQCVVLEDSEPGVTAAHNAGMSPIMIPDIKQPTREIEKLTYRILPDHFAVIECLKELL